MPLLKVTKNPQEKPMSLQEIGMKFYETRAEKEFTAVYHRLKPSISHYLRELVPNQDDRNEVIATTFSKVWAKIHQYDPYWNFSTWVYRIARNEALLFSVAKREHTHMKVWKKWELTWKQKLQLSVSMMQYIMKIILSIFYMT
jgi:ADP-glucose pyrophosphorylase